MSDNALETLQRAKLGFEHMTRGPWSSFDTQNPEQHMHQPTPLGQKSLSLGEGYKVGCQIPDFITTRTSRSIIDSCGQNYTQLGRGTIYFT